MKKRVRLLAAKVYIRDAAITELSDWTRLHCAFCSSYLALLEVALDTRMIAKPPVVPEMTSILGAFDAVQVQEQDKLATLRMETWLNAYDLTKPMPCSVEESIAIAERINLRVQDFISKP